MGRTIPTGLQPLLDLISCNTQTTVSLHPVSGPAIHLATDAFSNGVNTYSNDLRKADEIQQSILAVTDRVRVSVQNIDKIIGTTVAAESLAKGEGIVGRLYRDEHNFANYKWVELFRGEIVPLEVNEVETRIEIVHDLIAAGFCVAHWTLADLCQFVFKHAATCGYVGAETTCNKRRVSKGGCSGRANEHHFGGMEFPVVQAPAPPSGGSGGDDGGGGGWGEGPCFIGSMPVTVADDREVPFDEIYANRSAFIGSPIKSFDDAGRIRTDIVEAVFRHRVFEYLKVKFSTDPEPVGVTPNHRFWTALMEFKAIGEMHPGDKVEEHDGFWLPAEIESVELVRVPEGEWVYNLTTRRFHRYFMLRKGVSNAKPILQ